MASGWAGIGHWTAGRADGKGGGYREANWHEAGVAVLGAIVLRRPLRLDSDPLEQTHVVQAVFVAVPEVVDVRAHQVQTEFVHDRFLLDRFRTGLNHEGARIKLAAATDEPDVEDPVFVVHLDMDFDPARVGIGVAARGHVHERLLDTEQHAEPVLLR